jgi:hypothetical protein
VLVHAEVAFGEHVEQQPALQVGEVFGARQRHRGRYGVEQRLVVDGWGDRTVDIE